MDSYLTYVLLLPWLKWKSESGERGRQVMGLVEVDTRTAVKEK